MRSPLGGLYFVVIVHPPVSRASFVPVTITEVPAEYQESLGVPTGGEPTLGVKPVMVGGVGRVVARTGTKRDEIGINSADASSKNTTNEEPILVVVNSGHALLNRDVRII